MTNQHQKKDKQQRKAEKKAKLSMALVKNITRRKLAKQDTEKDDKK